jgi:putative DNA primase/helicase
MRSEWFDFPALFKIWIDGNYKPIITGTDSAIWNRIVLIPFDACFTGRKDEKLASTLRGELSGILNWAIAGFLDWQANDFVEPECSRVAKEEYRKDQDTYGLFLDEVLYVTGKAADKIPLNDMYNQLYGTWCLRSGLDADNKIVFGRKLIERGLRQDAGRRHWLGVKSA